MRKLGRRWLFAALLPLLFFLLLGLGLTREVPARDAAEKLEAEARMQVCMDRVKTYKAELGLELSPEDIHHTGMIGEPYTFITTTSGALEAKRTTAEPVMAALAVQLLHEAGLRPGDRVGAGFSGSFPALNLAVLCACGAMGVEIDYIASVGASTYGANQPALTFPDMALRLSQEGLIPAPGAFSLGGWRDCGLDMDPELSAEIRTRLEESGVPLLYEEDFSRNLARREAFYAEKGPISCFIGVGGNLTTLGQGAESLPYGLIPPDTLQRVTEHSGLVERYNARGLPVLHLLNIKRLAADYGLPYDPEAPAAPGESALYVTRRFPPWTALAGLTCAGAVLVLGRVYGTSARTSPAARGLRPGPGRVRGKRGEAP